MATVWIKKRQFSLLQTFCIQFFKPCSSGVNNITYVRKIKWELHGKKMSVKIFPLNFNIFANFQLKYFLPWCFGIFTYFGFLANAFCWFPLKGDNLWISRIGIFGNFEGWQCFDLLTHSHFFPLTFQHIAKD